MGRLSSEMKESARIAINEIREEEWVHMVGLARTIRLSHCPGDPPGASGQLSAVILNINGDIAGFRNRTKATVVRENIRPPGWGVKDEIKLGRAVSAVADKVVSHFGAPKKEEK